MTRLIHAASVVVDYVYRINELPRPGMEETATSHARVAGGGFNMMAAATRAGLPVTFVGRHGAGPDGDLLRAAMIAEGVKLATPPADEKDSGNCVVLVSHDAERTFISWPGAEATLRAAHFDGISVRPGDWVFVSGYTLSYPGSCDALAEWIEALPRDDVQLVFDPTPVVGEIPEDILKRVLARTTWLSCNDAEAEAITGESEVTISSERLIRDFCPIAQGAIIRSGAAGAFVRLREGRAKSVPGFKVEAIDTNGAGDTHIGAFVAALSRGANPFFAALYANAAAAISVTRHGGSSAPTDAEIQAFLADRRAGDLDEDRKKQSA